MREYEFWDNHSPSSFFAQLTVMTDLMDNAEKKKTDPQTVFIDQIPGL